MGRTPKIFPARILSGLRRFWKNMPFCAWCLVSNAVWWAKPKLSRLRNQKILLFVFKSSFHDVIISTFWLFFFVATVCSNDVMRKSFNLFARVDIFVRFVCSAGLKQISMIIRTSPRIRIRACPKYEATCGVGLFTSSVICGRFEKTRALAVWLYEEPTFPSRDGGRLVCVAYGTAFCATVTGYLSHDPIIDMFFVGSVLLFPDRPRRWLCPAWRRLGMTAVVAAAVAVLKHT